MRNIFTPTVARFLLTAFVLFGGLFFGEAKAQENAPAAPTANATPDAAQNPAKTTPPRAGSVAPRGGGSGTANPVVLILVVGALALAPFGLIMLTSFVKISVVLSILRNALGTQQVPPNQVITGISLILTIFIMSPVAQKMYNVAGTDIAFDENVTVTQLTEFASKGREPLREFLKRHIREEDRALFYQLAVRLAMRNGFTKDEAVKDIGLDDYRIIVPAFVTSQLTDAFLIGFILFIPFLVIDMVVSNVLQAMGMFMLSPTTISLPFKLLLFVSVNGWARILQELVLGYV